MSDPDHTCGPSDADAPVELTDAQWRDRLAPDVYQVLRHEATERPYSSPLNHEHRDGIYRCAGCGQALFRSQTKFDAGCGWPSFNDAIPGAVETKADHTLARVRTEYHCSRCGGHLGHVFDDGPAPTGLRYCQNGLAVQFDPAGRPGADRQ